MNAETFNALHPVGTPVFAYPGFRPEDDRNATRLVTRTRSKASVFGDAPVVMVDGYERINLTHVDVISEDEFKEARAAETPAVSPPADAPVQLDDQRLAEISERTPKRAAALTAWLDQFSPVDGQRALENAETVLEEDVPALLAEVQRLKAERHSTNEVLSDAAEALREMRDRVAELETELAEAVSVSETLYQRLTDEKLAGSALYAALTMPTTPEQRQAALDRFTDVAQRTGQLHAPSQAPTNPAQEANR